MSWPSWIGDLARLVSAKQVKPRTSWQQLIAILERAEIELVLDIGANAGQYAKSLRRYGYLGSIRSFEPLPDLNADLTILANGDSKWTIDPPFALGGTNATVNFLRSKESDMSSLLPQTELQRRLSPSSATSQELAIQQRRLDDVIVPPNVPTHLKIDVQGNESAVLDGASDLLESIETIQLEMALVAIYEGETLWRDMIERLERRGFELHLIIPGYFERKIARQLQVDGIFRRK